MLPEFHVFFNDQIDNDFNTLFNALPLGREYTAAGVPGSFYGRLFPKSSMNLMHCSTSLHWLKRVPQEVTRRDSPSWNKGRITYVKSSIPVVNAFRDQFSNDLKDFLKARSVELAPGGLLAILMMARPDDTLPPDAIYMQMFECLGDALVDAVKEGVIGEDLADSFNIPIFIPSKSEVKEVISSNNSLSIEMFQEIHYPKIPKTPGHSQMLSIHGRAILEGIVSEHFGPKLTDEIFERYPKKLKSFIETPYCARIDKQVNLFLLLKRRG
ncbi:OLC1v1037866C2 [Oldenlandia corymbosa var. corymbosa]|nr:OLC1v1037866C2 [Oldenlandia corymbosa var. corymbosa]